MRIIDRLLNKNKLGNTDMARMSVYKQRELSVFEKYPDGIPLDVLETVDFSQYGAMLKADKLLPPSYDRKPCKVQIGDFFGTPRVILTFQSRTTGHKRYIGIFRYSVSYSRYIQDPIQVLEPNQDMAGVWLQFAENVMRSWEIDGSILEDGK